MIRFGKRLGQIFVPTRHQNNSLCAPSNVLLASTQLDFAPEGQPFIKLQPANTKLNQI
jgi:hypothetical protein